jgi:25S rRNA (uracil2634-N3)-methyltransferase
MLVRFLVSVAPFLTTGAVPSYASLGKESNQSKRRKKEKDDEEEGEKENGDELDQEAMLSEEHDSIKPGFTVPSYAGSLLITLRNCKPYTLWDVPTLAKRLPSMYNAIENSAPSMSKGMKGPTAAQVAQLLSIGQGRAYRVWRSFQFHPEHWPEYTHRRTIGWKQERSTSQNEDISRSQEGERGENRTWELSLAG